MSNNNNNYNEDYNMIETITRSLIIINIRHYIV